MKWTFAAVGGGLIAAQFLGAPAQAAMTVSADPTQNVSCAGGVCSATANGAVLNFKTLKSMLAHGDVTLVPGEQAQDIVFASTVRWASSRTLTLDAFRGVEIDRPMQATGEGGLTVTVNDGGQGGRLTFGMMGSASFMSLSSPLTINGQVYTLVPDIATLASSVSSNALGHYALAAAYNAHPDGVYTSSPVTVPLGGVFEGLGNGIDGLQIDTASVGSSAGLFSSNLVGGLIENVRLTHLSIYAGSSNGLVSNVGGVVGLNAGTVRSAYVAGPVRGWAATASGAIAGENTGTIDNSRSASNVSGNIAGGIAGENTGTIQDCMATKGVRAIINAGTPFAGGIVGANLLGTITNSFATGPVAGIALSTVGGAVGNNTGTISYVYALGSVAGNNSSMAGGLVGSNVGSITQSYAAGQVTAGSLATIGGFVGTDLTILPGISSSYWDTTTSGISSTHGAGNKTNDAGITGLTDAQLKSGMPSGFSNQFWNQNGSTNGSLPYLIQLQELPPT
ncbi:MAG TPA: hypothetical protein VFV07_14170 [Rhizomicrobium sp.]|nr:hypothetical protein [Rhizomicrobium sp.]